MLRILTITRLTIHEVTRRKVLLATVIFGLAFVGLFALGLHFIHKDVMNNERLSLARQRMMLNFFVMAGLYAVNFLTIMTAALTPVDTLSGEIGSGVMQTVASKPIRRAEIVLGKWLAFALIIAGYLTLMGGGVLLVGRLIADIVPPRIHAGLSLMLLEGLVLVTLSIAGGTRLSTIANGVAVFGLFGLAFIGGWVEQIGTLAGNDTARYIGTAASLLMPSESLWQLAAYHMQPALMRDVQLTPFSPASVPSPAMVLWACGYVVAVLALGIRQFARRPL